MTDSNNTDNIFPLKEVDFTSKNNNNTNEVPSMLEFLVDEQSIMMSDDETFNRKENNNEDVYLSKSSSSNQNALLLSNNNDYPESNFPSLELDQEISNNNIKNNSKDIFNDSEVDVKNLKTISIEKSDFKSKNSTVVSSDEESKNKQQASSKFWSVQRYQPQFDINTNTFLHRLKRSIFPQPLGSLFFENEEQRPDLYGPFQIATTLIFLMASLGNFANYISYTRKVSLSKKGDNKSSDKNVGGVYQHFEWNASFEKLSIATFFLYFMISIIPLILQCLLNRNKNDFKPLQNTNSKFNTNLSNGEDENGISSETDSKFGLIASDSEQSKSLNKDDVQILIDQKYENVVFEKRGLIEIISIYGYSLFVYVPVTFLSLIPNSLVRTILFAVALCQSTFFIIVNMRRNCRAPLQFKNRSAWPVLFVILATNIIQASLARFFFFDLS